MIGNVARLIFFFGLFFSSLMLSQSKRNIQEFKDKVAANSELFNTNIDKAYLQINQLIKESKTVKDSISEMRLLERKCRYFYNKNQVDSLIIVSEKLQKASYEYNNIYYEAMANVYIAETYSQNKFYDKAIFHLNNAYEILQKDQSKTKKIFYAKANVLSSFANVYLDKNEPKNAVKKLLEEIKSGFELKNHKEFAQFQYLNYANISNIYALYNMDSAYYYAKKSIEIKPSDISEDKSMIDNYTVIGQYFKSQKDYKNSVKNFHEALKISKKIGVELNINNIHKSLEEIYRENNQKDSADFYENKIKQYEFQTLQSKYNSLQEVISKDTQEQNQLSNKTLLLWGLSFVLLIGISLFLYFKFKKKKTEETNQNLHETYKHLIGLIQNNDPSFMFAFENVFPEFSDKLLKINPELQQSEIEFCALLKLKLTTKEIAKYTFIETRTVQNKKYRLRKKFEIPQSVDIYNWIDSI
ncbi:tetratricopeptide repeat protein [Chryseobacterium sp. MMS23-Vi53]|uniref:tetratricopeptide repeat protein n=1 Tax=Chryseobacterium sp. MMS23-Vi53 TaxID=3386644 RepID=UPI0039EADC1D